MLEFGNKYNFNTISNTVIDSNYKEMTVIGIGGFNQIIRLSKVFVDMTTLTQQLSNETGLSLLPVEKAMYYLLEDKYGNEVIISDDWIITDSITVDSEVSIKLEINNITVTDKSVILNWLRLRNYDITIL